MTAFPRSAGSSSKRICYLRAGSSDANGANALEIQVPLFLFRISVLNSRSKYRDQRREWRGLGAIAKLETAFHKTQFGFSVDPIMEPTGVGSRVNEQNDKSASLRGVMTFFGPCPDLAAIRRIAKHTMRSPILAEAIVLAGEIVFTFCIVRSRTWIERELEFAIEHVEEGLRRWPFAAFT